MQTTDNLSPTTRSDSRGQRGNHWTERRPRSSRPAGRQLSARTRKYWVEASVEGNVEEVNHDLFDGCWLRHASIQCKSNLKGSISLSTALELPTPGCVVVILLSRGFDNHDLNQLGFRFVSYLIRFFILLARTQMSESQTTITWSKSPSPRENMKLFYYTELPRAIIRRGSLTLISDSLQTAYPPELSRMFIG